ncbi:MAG: c-type cytochrome biogenesis protein CcmI [Zoogloeaceae bacterium]|jgi:cytochrome c-type biogenesis protein CcmH|nr:c-type cytochrome biogenesis protein CcmI [Zoogloeaceae bacterium]
MTGFLIAAVALVALALLLLLPPLLRRRAPVAETSRAAINAGIYRDQLAELERDFAAGSLTQVDYEEGRRELQRRLLEDAGGSEAAAAQAQPARKSALLIGLALPLAGALLYLALGNVAGLSPEQAAPKITSKEIENMVAALAARLEQNPGDAKGWTMLARSYKAMERYEDAVRAFEKAGALVNEDPGLLTSYAETLAISAGGSLRGRPSELIAQALKLDPAFPDALFLAGAAAHERKDYAAVVDNWERLLKQLPPDSEDAASLAASIESARAQAQQQSAGKPAAGKAQ